MLACRVKVLVEVWLARVGSGGMSVVVMVVVMPVLVFVELVGVSVLVLVARLDGDG